MWAEDAGAQRWREQYIADVANVDPKYSPQAADKVKPLSLYHRFVIALHSRDGVVETGPLGCPPEKRAAKLASFN
jgi:hypothetical protein